MKKWLYGFLLLLIILVPAWLGSNAWLKHSIEQYGSQQLGTPVQLQSARWQFFPLGAKLEKLQIGDPSQSTQDGLHIAKITVHVSGFTFLRHLWHGQVLIDDLDVQDIQFTIPRQEATAGTTAALPSLPALTVNLQQGLHEAQDQLQQQLAQIHAEGQTVQARWQQPLAQISDTSTLQTYQTRWQQLQQAPLVERIRLAAEWQRSIQQDRQQWKTLRQQLAADQQQLTEQMQHLAALPATYVQQWALAISLTQDPIAWLQGLMGGHLVGEQWQQRFEHLLALYKQILRYTAQDSTAMGDLTAAEQRDLVIQQLRLTGEINVLDQTIVFHGSGQHWASQPKQWPYPAELQLQGEVNQTVVFSINGRFDHRGETPSDQLDFGITDMLISGDQLPDNTAGAITLEQVLLSAKGLWVLQGQSMALETDIRLEDIMLTVDNEAATPLDSIIADTLSAMDAIVLSIHMHGDPQKPTVILNSTLDQALSQAVQQSLAGALQQWQATLVQQLNAQLTAPLQQLQKQQALLGTVDTELTAAENALQSLSQP